MYKWYIELIFNSGYTQKCIYNGDERNSIDVCKKLFEGNISNLINYLKTMDGSQFLFRLGEVAAIKIDSKEIK